MRMSSERFAKLVKEKEADGFCVVPGYLNEKLHGYSFEKKANHRKIGTARIFGVLVDIWERVYA